MKIEQDKIDNISSIVLPKSQRYVSDIINLNKVPVNSNIDTEKILFENYNEENNIDTNSYNNELLLEDNNKIICNSISLGLIIIGSVSILHKLYNKYYY